MYMPYLSSCYTSSIWYSKTYAFFVSCRRRIAPKELVYTLLDTLSYLKMNVFHFHLSDECIYSMESEV